MADGALEDVDMDDPVEDDDDDTSDDESDDDDVSDDDESDGDDDSSVGEGEDSDGEPGAENDTPTVDLETAKAAVAANPYGVAEHRMLCKALGDNYDALHKERLAFSKRMPMPADLWLDWLKDEAMAAFDAAGRRGVAALFERAVSEVPAVELWAQYLRWTAEEGSAADLPALVARAISTIGCHFMDGSKLWTIARSYAPGPERVRELYREQLQLPLHDYAAVRDEYARWEASNGMASDTAEFLRRLPDMTTAVMIRDTMEAGIAEAATTEAATERWQAYIDLEIRDQHNSTALLLCERAVNAQPNSQALWKSYCGLLNDSASRQRKLAVYERAVRSCWWSGPLWVERLNTMQEFGCSLADIVAAWTSAVGLPISYPDHMSISYACLMAHSSAAQAVAASDNATLLADIRASSTKVIAQFQERLTAALDAAAAPSDRPVLQQYREQGLYSLWRYWAVVEAYMLKGVVESDACWDAALELGFAKRTAAAWNDAVTWALVSRRDERVRDLYKRAVSRVNADQAQAVFDAWIQFEQVQGSFAHIKAANAAIDKQRDRVNKQLAKAARTAETQAPATGHATGVEPAGKPVKRKADGPGAASAAAPKAQPAKKEQSKAAKERPAKRPRKDAPEDSKQPDAPAAVMANTNAEAAAGGASEAAGRVESKVLFVPNFPADITKEAISQLFSTFATPKEVRVVHRQPTIPPLVYVEFGTEAEATAALQLNGHQLGREVLKVYVSAPTKDNSRNKLIHETSSLCVCQISAVTTEDRLREFFAPVGVVSDVELVSDRKGNPYAICTFEKADAAVEGLSFNGRELDGATLAVMPSRRRASKHAPRTGVTVAAAKAQVPRARFSLVPTQVRRAAAGAPSGTSAPKAAPPAT